MRENTEIDSRIIFLKDELDSDVLCDVVSRIYEYNEYDDDYELIIKDYKREPIRLVLNTPGGSAYYCLSLIDVITTSRTPIHTIAFNAFSAGFFLLISGHKRFAYPNSTIMYHQLQLDGFGGELNRVKDEVDESYRVQNILKNLVVLNTNLEKEDLDYFDDVQKDWYIDSDLALELGIIDEIIY